jgi:hypothetical protein
MGIPSGYTSGQVVQAVPSLSAYAVTSSTRPASPFDGQIISETDTDTLQVYKGSAWGNPSGLVLVKSQTIGSAVSTVTVSDAFNANYDAYKITITGGTNSSNADISMALGASTAGYYSQVSLVTYSGAVTTNFSTNNGANWTRAGGCQNGEIIVFEMNLFNPFLAKFTYFSNSIAFPANSGPGAGYHAVATSYSAFTIAPSAGTLTGGIIRVYGYTNS